MAWRPACSKRALPRCIGRTNGGLNSKLHAVCDGQGRPIILLLTEGQTSDHKGAALLLPCLPRAKEMLRDKGYDSRRFREALIALGIIPCIPSTRSRKTLIPLRQAGLSATPSHQEHGRPHQGLAPRRHALRPLRPHLLLRHLPRCDRPLLDQ
ncbi:hypothetical protein EBE87_25460 [Pseudoroseomonas wenyumeiae]|uniref:Transposase IS4-like domain-containing protein n=1 Tax=Teichococcus wenyumeiae TaxID=2478470 RepID=A0A3A9JVK3_9PROT|nr:hypothetical protein D6Z83_16710 [Pseudoroseomonas wenyumeiae]RMI15533.1 hypothetical protein EBE87_25460 [Pseudoroseomonas wenyumeiae]